MSRTYRNRHSVPKGWTVRDDGREYHESAPTRKAQREQLEEWRVQTGRSHARECPNYYPPSYRTRWTRKELKKYRKAHYVRYRAQVKNRMAHEEWDRIPRFRRTGGWLTW